MSRIVLPLLCSILGLAIDSAASADDTFGKRQDLIVFELESGASDVDLPAAVAELLAVHSEKLLGPEVLAVWNLLPKEYRQVTRRDPKPNSQLIPMDEKGAADDRSRPGLEFGFVIHENPGVATEYAPGALGIQIQTVFRVPYEHWQAGELMQLLMQERIAHCFAKCLDEVARREGVSYRLVSTGMSAGAQLPKTVGAATGK